MCSSSVVSMVEIPRLFGNHEERKKIALGISTERAIYLNWRDECGAIKVSFCAFFSRPRFRDVHNTHPIPFFHTTPSTKTNFALTVESSSVRLRACSRVRALVWSRAVCLKQERVALRRFVASSTSAGLVRLACALRQRAESNSPEIFSNSTRDSLILLISLENTNCTIFSYNNKEESYTFRIWGNHGQLAKAASTWSWEQLEQSHYARMSLLKRY